MNNTVSTTLKIVAAVILVLIIAHFWPGLAAIAFVGVTTALALTGSVIAGAAGVVAALIGILCAVGVVLIALGVVLSPTWVPILAIVGLIALIRSLSRPPAQG
jgi:hypothetical protein